MKRNLYFLAVLLAFCVAGFLFGRALFWALTVTFGQAAAAEPPPEAWAEDRGAWPETACALYHSVPVATVGSFPFWAGVLCADGTYVRL